jgi:hypothetical protein
VNPAELESGLDDRQLMALGRIAFWASRTEGILREIAEHMLRGEAGRPGDLVNTALRGAGYSELQGIVVRLTDRTGAYSEAEIAYVKSGLKVAWAAMEKRNVLLHGSWSLPGDDASTAHATAVLGKRSGRNPSRSEQFDVASADRLSTEISEAAEALLGVAWLIDGTASVDELMGDSD